VGLDVVGFCGERAPESFDRLVEPAEVAQRVAEVAVGFGAAGGVGDGASAPRRVAFAPEKQAFAKMRLTAAPSRPRRWERETLQLQ
jgi:hypothetical protein